MYDTLTEVTSHVPVTMMINSVENGDNFFASSDYPRHKKAFIGTGMEILEYDGGLSYHGKSLLIDHELCAVGSYNFDLRSTYMDTELMLVIQSEELTGQLLGYMGEIEKDCRTVVDTHNYIVPRSCDCGRSPLLEKSGLEGGGASAPASACAGLRIPEEAE